MFQYEQRCCITMLRGVCEREAGGAGDPGGGGPVAGGGPGSFDGEDRRGGRCGADHAAPALSEPGGVGAGDSVERRRGVRGRPEEGPSRGRSLRAGGDGAAVRGAHTHRGAVPLPVGGGAVGGRSRAQGRGGAHRCPHPRADRARQAGRDLPGGGAFGLDPPRDGRAAVRRVGGGQGRRAGPARHHPAGDGDLALRGSEGERRFGVTAGLLLTLFALALLDSLNPVTIAGAVFLLLTPRPVPRTLSFVAGAGFAYFSRGGLLYLGLGAVFVRVLGYPRGPWGVGNEQGGPREGAGRS